MVITVWTRKCNEAEIVKWRAVHLPCLVLVTQALEACGRTLRHLDVSDCQKLTDASLRAVGEKCDVLESLNVGMCPLLSSRAVQEVNISTVEVTVATVPISVFHVCTLIFAGRFQ